MTEQEQEALTLCCLILKVQLDLVRGEGLDINVTSSTEKDLDLLKSSSSINPLLVQAKKETLPFMSTMGRLHKICRILRKCKLL